MATSRFDERRVHSLQAWSIAQLEFRLRLRPILALVLIQLSRNMAPLGSTSAQVPPNLHRQLEQCSA